MPADQKPPQVPLVSQVLLDFADSTYLFKLNLRWIDAIQNDFGGMGLGQIGQLTMGPFWNALHVYKLIYYGLVGGGMAPVKAKKLCDLYIDGVPLARADDPSSPLSVARAIIGATWFGVPEEAGKVEAPATGAEDTSTSQDTTDKPSQRDRTSQPLPSYLLENG